MMGGRVIQRVGEWMDLPLFLVRPVMLLTEVRKALFKGVLWARVAGLDRDFFACLYRWVGGWVGKRRTRRFE